MSTTDDADKENKEIKQIKKEEDLMYDPSSLPSFLPLYYKFLFPYGPYYSWLNCNEGGLSNREFSFTLQNDIYVRYQSFSNQQEMEKEIKKINPHKIDIGAIYTRPPKDHNKYHGGAFKALEKELVFDIDMTDYDDVRKCCQGADICKKCWPLMTMAIKLIDRALKDDFGFQHRLWVYSGRRGVHCWVCDEKAKTLTNHARGTIVDYLSVLQGGNHTKRVTLKDPVHPFLRHCITIISKYHWDEYRQLQEILADSSDLKKILDMIPEQEAKEELGKELERGDMETRWQQIKTTSSQFYSNDMKKYRKMRYTPQEIMLEYCYPRLDAAVTTGLNHLLKSPFCVHPKTGRVCVPIDVNFVDDFDPFEVPTISQLCHEMDSKKSEEEEKDAPKTRSHIYRDTSLGKYVKIFEDFVQGLTADYKKQKQGLKDSTIEF